MLLHADEALGAVDQAGGQQHANHEQGTSLSCCTANFSNPLQQAELHKLHCCRFVPHGLQCVTQVYAEFCQIEKHIQNSVLPEEVKEEVAIFQDRWDKMHSPLHSVGYMLEPQFQGTNFGPEVRDIVVATYLLHKL